MIHIVGSWNMVVVCTMWSILCVIRSLAALEYVPLCRQICLLGSNQHLWTLQSFFCFFLLPNIQYLSSLKLQITYREFNGYCRTLSIFILFKIHFYSVGALTNSFYRYNRLHLNEVNRTYVIDDVTHRDISFYFGKSPGFDNICAIPWPVLDKNVNKNRDLHFMYVYMLTLRHESYTITAHHNTHFSRLCPISQLQSIPTFCSRFKKNGFWLHYRYKISILWHSSRMLNYQSAID